MGKYSQYGEIEKTQQPKSSKTAAIARGMVTGPTFGFGEDVFNAAIGLGGAAIAKGYDAVTGGELFPESFGDTVAEGEKLATEQDQAAMEDHPILYGLGAAASGIGSSAKLASMYPKIFGVAPQGAGFTARAMQLAKMGAAEGFLSGVGFTEGDAIDRGVGGLIGAGTGMVTAPVVGETARLATRAGASAINKFLGTDIPTNPTTKGIAKNDAEQSLVNELYSRDDLLNKVTDAQDLTSVAKKRGIDLTPGEALNDPTLMGKQAIIRNQPGEGALKSQQLMELRQGTQLPSALNKQISDISPVSSPDDAGRSLIEGAKNIEKGLRDALKTSAKPYYDAAFFEAKGDQLTPRVIMSNDKSGLMVDKTKEILSPITSNPDFKSLLSQVKLDPFKKDLPEDSLPFLDAVRSKALEVMRDLAKGGNKNTPEWRNMNALQSNINDVIEKNLTPEAKQSLNIARTIYSEGSPEIEKLIEGRLGSLAKVRDVAAYKAPEQLLTGSLEQTKEVASKLPQETKAGAAAIIQSEEGNLKGQAFDTIQKRIFNTPKQREQFQAMLGDKYEPFAQLMDIFERVGKGQRYLQGSPTQPLLKQSENMAKSISDMASDAITDKISFMRKVMQRITGETPEIRNANEAKFYNDLADAILTPRGLELIEEIAKKKPSIEQARRLLSRAQLTGGAIATRTAPLTAKDSLNVKEKKETKPSGKYGQYGDPLEE